MFLVLSTKLIFSSQLWKSKAVGETLLFSLSFVFPSLKKLRRLLNSFNGSLLSIKPYTGFSVSHFVNFGQCLWISHDNIRWRFRALVLHGKLEYKILSSKFLFFPLHFNEHFTKYEMGCLLRGQNYFQWPLEKPATLSSKIYYFQFHLDLDFFVDPHFIFL